MVTAKLSRAGGIYTLVVDYRQSCEKVIETFGGTAWQLNALLAQRQLESDRPKLHPQETSRIFTMGFLAKIRREIHRDSRGLAPATSSAAVGLVGPLRKKTKALLVQAEVVAPNIGD